MGVSEGTVEDDLTPRAHVLSSFEQLGHPARWGKV